MSAHEIYVHVPTTMLPDLMPQIRDLPVGLELLMDHEALHPDFAPRLDALAKALEDQRRPLRFHAPFRDLSPAGFDPEAVALARRRITAALELAPRFGVQCVVAHSNWHPDAHGLERAEWLERSLSFWRPVGELAQAAGARIALENVYDREPRLLRELLAELPAERFGANFDLGHWHAYSHADLGTWIGDLGDRLLSLHVHDNHGLEDGHLALGEGAIPWREFFALIRARGGPLDWTLENRSAADVQRSLVFLARESEIPEFQRLEALRRPSSGAGG